MLRIRVISTFRNMNNNAIQHVNFIGFQNQDLSVNGSSSLYIAADVVNGKNVMTISEGQGTSVGMIYDTVYNPLPTSGGGGGWVGTATSDLNMATHSITGVQGINTQSITVPYNEIYSQNTALVVTRDGGTNVGYIYDSHYNPPPTTAGPTAANASVQWLRFDGRYGAHAAREHASARPCHSGRNAHTTNSAANATSNFI